jgi:hypothetical protein
MKVFAGVDLTAYAPARYMPLPIATHTARQMIRQTKSATYPKIKITKAAITCSAILKGAKAIGDILGWQHFQKNSARTATLARGTAEICTVVNTFGFLFRVHLPHDQRCCWREHCFRYGLAEEERPRLLAGDKALSKPRLRES